MSQSVDIEVLRRCADNAYSKSWSELMHAAANEIERLREQVSFVQLAERLVIAVESAAKRYVEGLGQEERLAMYRAAALQWLLAMQSPGYEYSNAEKVGRVAEEHARAMVKAESVEEEK